MTHPAPLTPGRPGIMRARWRDPFPEMEGVYHRMGQLVQGLFGDLPSMGGIEQPPVWVPVADIEEFDDEFVVELELPRVRSEDIDLELRDDRLRVSGEVRERDRRGIMYRRGAPAGSFEYLVALPGDVDPERVDALLDEGVLT